MCMSAKSPALEGRLIAEIAESGPISFARFMECALYDRECGYYASGRAAIGAAGDFFTNVSVGPVFGEILAGQFVEMWEALGRPSDFRLIEQGANDGRLARDVLEALLASPLDGVPLTIIEPSDGLQQAQARMLDGFPVDWVSEVACLQETTGVHYSNELFDAFPVHLVRSDGRRWVEVTVESRGGALCWGEREAAGELAAAVAPWPARQAGFTTEVCLAYRPFLSELSIKLRRGFLLAVDYGLSEEALLAPHRTAGTLSCYRAHHRDANPLASPGEKDLSVHVNFTKLIADAGLGGWTLQHLTDQHHFLVGAATAMLLELDGQAPDAKTSKKLRSLRTLLHPEGMGRKFHALLFSKGVGPVQLSGFRHA